jgi:hypothetical protein
VGGVDPPLGVRVRGAVRRRWPGRLSGGRTGEDRYPAAAAQQQKGFDAIKAAHDGGEPIKLFENLRTDITGDIDLGSVKRENMKTRGTAGKRDPDFESSLDITSEDLDALVMKLLPPPAGGSK